MFSSSSRRLYTLIAILLVMLPLSGTSGNPISMTHAAPSLGGPPSGSFVPVSQQTGEVASLRTRTSKTVAQDGHYVTQVYQSSVNYLDASGAYQPIDNTLAPSSAVSGYQFANKANRYTARFGSDLSNGVRFETANGWASFSLAGGSGIGQVSGATDTYPTTGGSIALTAQADQLKEAITLSGSTSPSSYVYNLQTSSGIAAQQNASGGIDFVDRSGTVQFSFAPPSMTDQAGATSTAVSMTLGQNAVGAQTVTVSASPTWLADPSRQYPVVIDPTVTLPLSQNCTIVTGSTGGGCGGITPLKVGYQSSLTGAERALLQFTLPQSIPSTATILQADLTLNEYSTFNTTAKEVDVYGLTHSWTTSAGWTKYDGTNSWTTPGGDYATPAAATNTSVGPTNNTWYHWYPTSLVQSWVNGSVANDGFLLRQPTENTLNAIFFYASGGTYPPYLSITWAPGLGMQPWRTFAGGVNVASGNLVLAGTDVSMPGVGLPVSVGRVYNSLSTGTGDFGNHWLMDTGADVGLQIFSDGSVTLNGPSGFQAVFAKKADGTYVQPPGINSTLAKNQDGTYTLTVHANGGKLNFSSGGVLTSETTTTGNTLTFNYSGTKLSSIADTMSGTTTFMYNSPVSSSLISQITDSAGRTYSYGYDSSKNLTSFTRPDGKSEQYGYDAGGNLNQITDYNGNVATKITYDTSHRPSSIVDVLNPVAGTGPTTSYTYNSGNTVVTDPNNHNATFNFDVFGRVTSVTDPLSHTTSTIWNSNNDVTKITPPSGNATTFTYSGENLTSTTAANGATTSAQYTNTTWPNFPTSVTDAQGNTSTITYNTSTGTVASTTDPLTHNVSYTYNSNGTLATSTDENSNQTSYSYLSNGMLQTETPPTPLGAVSYTYNSLNLPATMTDGKGQTTTYTYDHSGNLTQSIGELGGMAYQNADHTSGGSTGFSYDANGNQMGLTDATGSTSYTYDNLNRQTSKTLPSGSTVACPVGSGGTNVNVSVCYGFDSSSNLLTKQDSQGTITYGYNTDSTLASVKDRLNATTNFNYDQDANLTSEVFPNGVTQAMTYNTAGQMTNVQAANGSNTLTSFTYSYLNPNTSKQTGIPYSVTDTAGNVTSYTYDNANQLTQALQKNSGGTQIASYSYGYDSAGNVTSQNLNGTSTTMTYNAANELTQATGGMNRTYTYDGNGDLISRSDGLSITLNAQDQLTSITPSGGSAINMSYTGVGEGQRVAAGANSYQYDATGMSMQTAGGSTPSFTALPEGTLLSETLSGSTYYYLSDGAGNVAGITGSSGTLINSYSYDPQGNITSQAGSAVNPFTYQGWTSDGTGLYYTGSGGYCDPSVGLQTGWMLGWQTSFIKSVGVHHKAGKTKRGLNRGKIGWKISYRPTGFPGLQAHWQNHVIRRWEWKKSLSRDTYREQAYRLFQQKYTANGPIRQATRINGDIIRYDVRTNEFGVLNKYGEITTYFLPTEGYDYFIVQTLEPGAVVSDPEER
jgi:YD repeat-containing protein